jgi:ribosome maturation factor RimP
MSMVAPLEQIENFLLKLIEKSEDTFLVEMKITPGNQITVLLDADNGITIENLEESGLFEDGNFSLEVSSPGIDKPLKLHRQYKKNIGRKVEVELMDGTKIEGTLTHVNDEDIIIEEKSGKGKKITMNTITILFNHIKHTTVLITF